MKKRILSFILSLALVLGLMPTTVLAIGPITVGPFTLTSAGDLVESTDYSYSNNTLTIKSGKSITISGTTTSDKIVIEDGVTANVTLSNVSVDVSNAGTCAFEVAGSAACNLTLEGTNMLKSGYHMAGLQVQGSASLTITENSVGILNSTGGTSGAGIGGYWHGPSGSIVINGGTIIATGGGAGAGIGGGQYGGSVGSIVINGGTITATGGEAGAGIGGGWSVSSTDITITGGTVIATGKRGGGHYGDGGGAGIGGGHAGSGGNIIISGGIVSAHHTGDGCGIGNGGSVTDPGTFSTGDNGNAVIISSSIGDKTHQDSWSGIIFDGNNGVVYGNQTLPIDLEVSGGKALSIPEDSSLTINKDVTVTNNGTLVINGTFINSGEMINNGTITVKPVDGYHTVSTALTYLTFAGNYRAKAGEDYAATINLIEDKKEDYTLAKSIKVEVGGKLLTEGENTYTYDSDTGQITIKAAAITGDILITANVLFKDVASDFTVTATNSGETLEYGIDYTYPTNTNVLTILSDKAITISNADSNTATNHIIYVEDGVNANVTLAGVNIYTPGNGIPFQIADNSTGDVTVTLADGTENKLISGKTDTAGLQKNGDTGSGTLTINGNGTLTATGNHNGPGIGGSPTANIVIESGTIIANGTSGAGIGSTYRGNASNITIQGGTVTAAGGVRTTYDKSYYGAGIGSGANGSASNIVITGGSVYATAQGGGAQPIGKGSGSGTAGVPTDGSGNRVYLYEIENPQKADIVINGKDYPDAHGGEAKIYAYLPAKTAQDPNVVTIGDTTTKWYYNSRKWIDVVDIPATDSTTFTYTGQEQTYTIAGSDYYTISGNKQTNAGTHTVTVALKDKDNTAWSDGTTEDKAYSFVIGKATPQEGYVPDCELTLTENTDGTFTATITPVDGAEYSFDGQNWSSSNTKKVNHKEEVTGYIRYVETDNYIAGKAASKTVTAGHGTLEYHKAAAPTCTEDGNNEYYYCPVCNEYFSDAGAQNEMAYRDTVIDKKGHDFSGDFDAYNENGHWHICNREDCTATDTPVSHSFTSYVYNNDATYFEDGTETAVCDAAGCEQTYTRTKTGTKLIDAVNPTGEITVKENKWKSFINTITFNIFCKDKYDVTITANDNETGIASVEYLLSETAISESGIANETGWKAYSAFSIAADGRYIIYAKILDKAGNVTYLSSDGLVLDSTAATAPVVTTNGYNPGEWTNKDVVLTVSGSSALSGIAKYQVSTDNGRSWTDMEITDGKASLTVSDDTNGTVYSFRAVSVSGVEGETVSVTVKIDKTAPDGDITMEKNSVKEFINNVTFGLFFKENVEVAITGTDSGSGVQAIEYYRSAEALTEEQVAALTDGDWEEYTGTTGETAQEAEKFVYYVRITDQAGNVACFASNGATYDLTRPVITGVTDGTGYYTTQNVQVTDANLASVTLNGAEVGTEFILAGNTEAEYVIVAADKAGNETTVTVTMQTADSLRENLGDITKENATSADRETVQGYLDDLKERLEDEKLTDEEMTILEKLADEAQDILGRLDETEQAGSTEAVDQTKDITPGNVTPEDKEALEQAKGDIEQAIGAFGGNYTDEEKARLEDDLSRIKEALNVIERIEDTEDAIEALPDTVSPDDTGAEELINAAKGLYDGLSEYGKSLVSDETAEKLERLLAQLGDYRIIEGSGATWTKGNAEGLTITANGAYSKFTGIEIDGNTVSPEHYTAESGSTVITLKADYLDTLASGEHTIAVLYTDGKATDIFTIPEEPSVPADGGNNTTAPGTGGNSNIPLWVTIMLAAGAILASTSLYSRKKKHSR